MYFQLLVKYTIKLRRSDLRVETDVNALGILPSLGYHCCMVESRKILFFPGAFNPPHLGHAYIIEMVLSQHAFDEVWVMPSGKRDDKVIAITYENRLSFGTMFVAYVQSRVSIPVKLLTSNIDNIEGKRSHREVLDEVLEAPNVDVYGLIGTDSFLQLHNKIGDAINKYKFFVVTRPGYGFPNDLTAPLAAIVINGRSPDISSTQIRALVQLDDKSYTALVPEAVAEYIEKHTLYRM